MSNELLTAKEQVKILREDNMQLRKTVREMQRACAQITAFGWDYLHGNTPSVDDEEISVEEMDDMLDELDGQH